MAMETEKRQVTLTGVREIDERLGGGIPIGSLALIEGHSDAGKSVLCQHLVHGGLNSSQICAAYYTTENTVKSLITQMDSLSLFTLDYFLTDRLRIYPMTLRSAVEGSRTPFSLLIEHFSSLPRNFTLLIVDSITLLVAHSDPVSITDFFSECKDLCDDGRSIMLVAHSYAFDEELLVRIRSLCDAHLKLRLEQVGERLMKIMEVLKVRGADRPTGDVVSFEVEPKVGMRIIPMSRAQV